MCVAIKKKKRQRISVVLVVNKNRHWKVSPVLSAGQHMPECLESLKQLPKPHCSTGSWKIAPWWARGQLRPCGRRVGSKCPCDGAFPWVACSWAQG